MTQAGFLINIDRSFACGGLGNSFEDRRAVFCDSDRGMGKDRVRWNAASPIL